MKKSMKVLVAVIISLTCIISLGACAKENQDLNFGKSLVKTDGMIDILREVSSKTSDVGIMDSTMANYYMKQDTLYASKLMIIEDLVLAEEKYGIATRKSGASTIYEINKALIELKNSGKVTELATKYGLANDEIIDVSTNLGSNSLDNEWATIKASGTIKIGYTVFAPIAYKDANDQLIGFDIDLAKAVGEHLGVEVQFVEIEWKRKEVELEAKNIDLIWNGMTITDKLQEALCISIPYLSNKQVAVIRKEDKELYKTLEDMSNAIIAAESGSAGQGVVEKK